MLCYNIEIFSEAFTPISQFSIIIKKKKDFAKNKKKESGSKSNNYSCGLVMHGQIEILI